MRADGDGLLVSDYLREVRVAFGEIAEVARAVGRRENSVIVTFRHETPISRRATFIPASGRDDEIVAELRGRAGLATEAAPDART